MAFLLPIVGYAFFGPWGALIGGLLQSIFFKPEGPKGPRLNELNVQHSTVGAPIPIVYGTAALAGNIIWSGGLIETKHEDEQGGKFGIGGTKVTSYTYSADVAVGICEGEISGIRRIWADADLIYDASDDATLAERLQDAVEEILAVIAGIRAASAQLNFTLYTGTEDQLPDPTIETYKGVGNVPAYRGLAYIVFNDFQLEKYGNRIPNFRFEVTSNGTDIECGVYTGGTLYPWLYDPASAIDAPQYYNPNTNDPRNPLNNHLYKDCHAGVFTPTDTFAVAKAALEASYSGRPFLIDEAVGPDVGDNIFIQGWALSSTPNYIRPCDGYGDGSTDAPVAGVDYLRVTLRLNSIHGTPNERVYCSGLGGPEGFDNCDDRFNYATWGIHDGQASGFKAIDDLGHDPAWLFEGVTESQDVDNAGVCGGPEPTQRWLLTDQEMCCARSIQPLDTWAVTWTEVSGTFKVLQKYTTVGNAVTKYPADPAVKSDSIFYNDQDYWEAAYADYLASGAYSGTAGLGPGAVYGVDYPVTTSTVWRADCTAIEVACMPMATIVADICRRAGLRTDTSTQIDVSDLTTCVQGYIIGRQMSARDALGPLRMYGLWDAVESDALLKFVERGHAIAATLTDDDLGAHEAGSQAPPAMEVARVQEKELPRRVRLHFANFLHDHEASEQSASRLATEAVDELDVELPISMEPDTAKQLAEIMLYEAYVSRSAHRFALDNNWLALEPTDCIEIPVDGQTERVRIVSIDYSIGGIIKIDALRDDDGSYVSTAVATPSQPSGGVPGGPGSGPICPSGVVLLDLPRLNAAHIDAGYYAAIYSTCPEFDSWACAELYRSNDGGVTYGRVARTNAETTVGQIVTITGPATDPTLPGDSPAYDTSNSITVELFVGELASITDAQIAAGQNMAAIGQDGSWVIIQFKTATFDTGETWVLTDLIWGLNDTQHLLGTTGNGDTFVLLSDADLLRIPESADAIGVQKQFKVVTCGEAIDAVTEFDFTTWGLSYLRLCPSTVISCSTTEPPVSPTDGDAYYLPNDTSLGGVWALHGGEIAKWSDETDSWVYCTPDAGTILHCSDEDEDVIPPGGGGDPTPAPWQQVIDWQDEGVTVADTGTTIDTVNFVGPGVTATLDSSGALEVNIPGGSFDTSGDVDLALDQLSDVTIGSPLAEGDLLTYQGTEGWINAPASDHNHGIPQNAQTVDYTVLDSDNGKHLYHASGAGAGDTYTFDIATLAIGHATTIFNLATDSVEIAFTNGTGRWIGSGAGATGTRTLAQYGHCTVVITLSNEAVIDGVLLT